MGATDEYNNFLNLGTLISIKWYEIEAEISGKIEKVCVNNGDAIEFGQTLFLVSQS